MKPLRIGLLRFGAGRQKMVLERWTHPKLSRRACSLRYEVPSRRGKSAGAAKRPCERSPTRNPQRHDSQLFHRCATFIISGIWLHTGSAATAPARSTLRFSTSAHSVAWHCVAGKPARRQAHEALRECGRGTSEVAVSERESANARRGAASNTPPKAHSVAHHFELRVGQLHTQKHLRVEQVFPRAQPHRLPRRAVLRLQRINPHREASAFGSRRFASAVRCVRAPSAQRQRPSLCVVPWGRAR
jgi:hypothetical protein